MAPFMGFEGGHGRVGLPGYARVWQGPWNPVAAADFINPSVFVDIKQNTKL